MAQPEPEATDAPQTTHRADALDMPQVDGAIGSLGSAIVTISGGSPEAFKDITDSCRERFRKGWRDMKSGVAIFMAPSGPHAIRTNDASSLIHAVANAMQIPVVSLRDRTVNADGAEAEPDDSFLIGDTAARYLAIKQSEGSSAALEWLESANIPPDLVIEVEHTHHNAGKQGTYRNAGVSELWEIPTERRGRKPKIIALDGAQGPFGMDESHLLPGVRPECILGALRILDRVGDSHKFSALIERGSAIVQQFLDTATGLANEDNNDAGGSPASP